MYKYQSVSDFSHAVFLGGKKYLIKPGEIVSSQTPLSYIFLDRVDDNTPTTPLIPHQSKQVVAVSEVSNTVSSVNNEVSSIKEKLDAFIDKYESDMQNLMEQINKHFADIEQKELNKEKEQNLFQETVNRRLGILKDAVRTIEDEVYGEPTEKNA